MTSEPLDTQIVNGRFVVNDEPAISALTIHDGVVVGAADERDVWRTVNASGHYVFPGLIQPCADLMTESLGLVRGGVTTAIVPFSNAISPDRAQLDYVEYTPDLVERIVLSSASESLSDSDWDALAGDRPVHVCVDGDAAFPLIHYLFHEGHIKRGLTLERIADVTARSVARALGLFPHKASFQPGSHGDLFVFDPESPDPYRDLKWPGRVIFSLQRGNILLFNGQIHTDPGDGQRLAVSD